MSKSLSTKNRMQLRHKIWDQYPDRMNIFSAAIDAHMIANGSYETNTNEKTMLRDFLKCVLDTWDETCATFDILAQKLVREALEELQAYLES